MRTIRKITYYDVNEITTEKIYDKIIFDALQKAIIGIYNKSFDHVIFLLFIGRNNNAKTFASYLMVIVS